MREEAPGVPPGGEAPSSAPTRSRQLDGGADHPGVVGVPARALVADLDFPAVSGPGGSAVEHVSLAVAGLRGGLAGRRAPSCRRGSRPASACLSPRPDGLALRGWSDRAADNRSGPAGVDAGPAGGSSVGPAGGAGHLAFEGPVAPVLGSFGRHRPARPSAPCGPAGPRWPISELTAPRAQLARAERASLGRPCR